MTYARMLMILLLPLVSLVSACKSDSQSDTQQGGDGSGAGADVPVVVAGRVVSGFPVGAEIRVFAGSAGAKVIAPEVATDAGGKFQLAVDSKYLFMPVVIEANIVAGQTALTCTSLNGCPSGARFGEIYTSIESETIYAAVPLLRRMETYNISRLTDMAYLQAASQDGGGEIWTNPVATANQQMTFERENSRVASRFNVIGSLSSFATADFTSAAEVAASGADALYYSALDAAVVEASSEKYPQSSPVRAYQLFAEDFVRFGIADNTGLDSVVSYADILAKLISFFRLHSTDIEAVALLRNELAAARAVALSGVSDQYEAGTSSTATGLTSIDKGKLFVENIRQIASSVDLSKIASLSDVSGFVDGNAGEALDAFNLKLDAAEVLTGEEPAYLRLALVRTAKAVFRAALAFYFDGGEPAFTEDGVSVAITDTGNGVEFVVDQVISVCDAPQERCAVAVDVRATFHTDRLTGSSEGALAAKALTITFAGRLANERLSLSFAPGQEGITAREVFISMNDIDQDGAKGFSIYLEAEALSAQIRALLARLDNMPEQITVNALVEIDSDELAFEFTNKESSVAMNGGHLRHVERGIVIDDMVRFDARGGMVISRGDNESFLAGASGSAAKPLDMGMFAYSTSETLECGVEQEECIVHSEESNLEGEGDASFIALNLSTLFKAHLAGVAEPVLVQVSSVRESATANKIEGLKVTYPGHALSLNGQFNNNGGIASMNATNLDGMEMFIKSGDTGKRYGAVSGPGGEQVGEVIDMGEWIKIRYPDGNFVSM